MDEFVRKAAGLGVPMIVLLIVMATTGLSGAAAITAALAMLGPAGMMGGIAFLGIIGLATESLSKYGLEELLKAIYCQRCVNGEPKNQLIDEINWLWISSDLKRCLVEAIVAEERELQ